MLSSSAVTVIVSAKIYERQFASITARRWVSWKSRKCKPSRGVASTVRETLLEERPDLVSCGERRPTIRPD